jgi:hypothetical protein
MKKTLFVLTIALASTTANASTWNLVGQQFLDNHYYCTYQAPNTNLMGADPRLGSPVLTTTIELQPGQICPSFINR